MPALEALRNRHFKHTLKDVRLWEAVENRRLGRTEHDLVSGVDLIWCCSTPDARRLTELYSPKAPIAVVPNTINLDACGCAVVSTAKGAAGIDFVDGRELRVAETASEFADAIRALWRDNGARLAQTAAALRRAETDYSWPAAARIAHASLHDHLGIGRRYGDTAEATNLTATSRGDASRLSRRETPHPSKLG